MPKTISELEAQRAKILKEIESKAGNVNTVKKDKAPSLNDWLNAAEEVMPESEKKASSASSTTTAQNQPNESYSSKILKTSHSNTSNSPFFSIVILLTLFFTLVGVIYIVYSTLNKDLTEVSSYKEQSTQQINELQDGLNSIQKSIATGGKTELFANMETQVADLKEEVASLKNKVAELESLLANAQNTSKNEVSETMQKAGADTSAQDVPEDSTAGSSLMSNMGETNKNQVVTEAILDKKLKLYYQQLESKIDQKLNVLIKLIPEESLRQGAQKALEKTQENADQNTVETNNIEVPTVETVKTPEVSTPDLTPVAAISAPSIPSIPTQPKAAMTEDEEWLLEQPKKHYILQLASMPTESQIKRVLAKNKLDAKIVSQTRNGATNYILVSKAFQTKAAAQKLSDEIKSDKGISAWIRQVEDISRRVK